MGIKKEAEVAVVRVDWVDSTAISKFADIMR